MFVIVQIRQRVEVTLSKSLDGAKTGERMASSAFAVGLMNVLLNLCLPLVS